MDPFCRHVLVAVVLVGAYVASYLAAVDRDMGRVNVNSRAHLHARYRLGGAHADVFFSPLHLADRHIRRDYWEPEAHEILDFLIANLDELSPSDR